MIYNILRLASVVAIFLISEANSVPVWGQQSDSMTFEAVPPIKPTEIFGNAWSIYASGKIESSTPQKLNDLIKKLNISDSSFFFLNSPGGSVFASMEIGKIIRAHNFSSYVGSKGAEEPDLFNGSRLIGGKRYKHNPGVCFSACTLSFLGGAFRYFSDSDGMYGVHRFFASPGGTLDSDSAQIVSASILQYIRDMGVDQKFFSEMVKGGREDMIMLRASQLNCNYPPPF